MATPPKEPRVGLRAGFSTTIFLNPIGASVEAFNDERSIVQAANGVRHLVNGAVADIEAQLREAASIPAAANPIAEPSDRALPQEDG